MARKAKNNSGSAQEPDLDLGDCAPQEWDIEQRVTALHRAAQELDLPRLRSFLSSGKFDVNAVTRETKYTPLREAIEADSITPERISDKNEAIKLLVSYGGEIDSHDCVGATPLHRCAESDSNLGAAKALLELGANPNVDNREHVSTDGHAGGCGCGNSHALSGLLSALTGGEFNGRAYRQDATPVHVAARKGQTEMVRLLLEYGGKADAYDNDDGTPVQCAIQSKNLETVKLLLEAEGAMACLTVADKMGQLPIHSAGISSPEVLRYILSLGLDVDAQNTVEGNWRSGQTALACACNNKEGYSENAKILLEAGADPNKQLGRKATPFLLALNSGNEEVAKVLLDNGADWKSLESADIPPLLVAATRGHSGICKLLIKKGCDVNLRTDDGDEFTPLHNAAGYGGDKDGNAKCILTLISEGADIEARNYDGRRPLHMACFKGRINCVRQLLRSGADIDVLDDNSWSPLHFAAWYGHLEIIKLLLEKGANVSLITTDGPGGDLSDKTAADLARQKTHLEIVSVLASAEEKKLSEESQGQQAAPAVSSSNELSPGSILPGSELSSMDEVISAGQKVEVEGSRAKKAKIEEDMEGVQGGNN